MLLANMFKSGPRLSKSLITIVACIGSDSGVCPDVTYQGEFNGERLAADMTLVRTNTSVDATVTLQIVGLCEGLATLRASVWSSARVNELMTHERITMSKRFVTGRTLIGPFVVVCLHVGQQRRLQGEGSTTDLALIRLNPRMRAAVCLQATLL